MNRTKLSKAMEFQLVANLDLLAMAANSLKTALMNGDHIDLLESQKEIERLSANVNVLIFSATEG